MGRALPPVRPLSRLKEPENSSIESKLRVYDGENVKDIDPKAKSIQEYRDAAGVDEQSLEAADRDPRQRIERDPGDELGDPLRRAGRMPVALGHRGLVHGSDGVAGSINNIFLSTKNN